LRDAAAGRAHVCGGRTSEEAGDADAAKSEERVISHPPFRDFGCSIDVGFDLLDVTIRHYRTWIITSCAPLSGSVITNTYRDVEAL
jgi:hypothetical protein